MAKVIAAFSGLLFCGLAIGAEFSSEETKDYPIRSKDVLEVRNSFGDIEVRGWASDRLRVIIKKVVQASNEVQGKERLETLSYRYTANSAGVEISGSFGEKVSVENRLNRKSIQQSRISLIVFGPPKMKLSVWGKSGRLAVRNWEGEVTSRISEGVIDLENLRAPQVTSACIDCDIFIRKIEGQLRCQTVSGNIHIQNAKGSQVFAESSSGNLYLTRIEGPQMLINGSGQIVADKLSGGTAFRVDHGNVVLTRVDAPFVGTSSTGTVRVGVSTWNDGENSAITTSTGRIEVRVPAEFAANVEFSSQVGRVLSHLTIEPDADLPNGGQTSSSHVLGRVNEGGSLLKLESNEGDVFVNKGEF